MLPFESIVFISACAVLALSIVMAVLADIISRITRSKLEIEQERTKQLELELQLRGTTKEPSLEDADKGWQYLPPQGR